MPRPVGGYHRASTAVFFSVSSNTAGGCMICLNGRWIRMSPACRVTAFSCGFSVSSNNEKSGAGRHASPQAGTTVRPSIHQGRRPSRIVIPAKLQGQPKHSMRHALQTLCGQRRNNAIGSVRRYLTQALPLHPLFRRRPECRIIGIALPMPAVLALMLALPPARRAAAILLASHVLWTGSERLTATLTCVRRLGHVRLRKKAQA